VIGGGRATSGDIGDVTRHLTGIAKGTRPGFDEHQQDALVVALCCALREGYLTILEPQED
jgi:hypothetical protein